MKKIILFLIIITFASVKIYSQSGEIQKVIFLDSTDMEVMLAKKKIHLFELTGFPVDSSHQSKRVKYIFNYLVKSTMAINDKKLSKLISPLLACDPQLLQIPKCTFLAKYCLEIKATKGVLYLFYSGKGDCDTFIKVIKVNTLTHKENHKLLEENQFAGIF